MVRHDHGMAMEDVALECMQMKLGWVEWASQVEHSSGEEQRKSKASCVGVHIHLCAFRSYNCALCVIYV